MQPTDRLIAIYDFEFFPYALGDVLTWNIRTAMRCEELGKKCVDLYVCLDERYPASIYQRGLVNPDNFDLFFSELYGAFGTHPKLGNLHIFRNREAMLEQLSLVARDDRGNQEAFNDYLKVMKYSANHSLVSKSLSFLASKGRIKTFMKRVVNRLKRSLPKKLNEAMLSNLSHEYALNAYFIQYVYSHEAINAYYAKHHALPLLRPSLGCTPDVDEIIARKFKGKILVPFHLRQRRLDLGYGGDHSYARDSSFIEWYNFLREAAVRYPQVQFIALGRLQEKPLALLRLPNVASLRLYGLGLGHELTLMLKSHFFIGSSSGFAALANFSKLPYFITRMNPGSCKAYAIPENAEKLPFAAEDQKLIYEEESSALLMKLLEAGLERIGALASILQPSEAESAGSMPLNIAAWHKLQATPQHKASTTCRFYEDEGYHQHETAYLLLPYLEEARKAFLANDLDAVRKTLTLLEQNFPALCEKMQPYLLLQSALGAQSNIALVDEIKRNMQELNFAEVNS